LLVGAQRDLGRIAVFLGLVCGSVGLTAHAVRIFINPDLARFWTGVALYVVTIYWLPIGALLGIAGIVCGFFAGMIRLQPVLGMLICVAGRLRS
jgi:hypothetical protein